MRPATAPQSERLGYLFLNPGGPGGSGTDEIISAGEKLSVIVQGRYDLVSFDPRTVNLTSPSLNCGFPTFGDTSRFIFKEMYPLGLPSSSNSSESELRRFYQRWDAYAKAASQGCLANSDSRLLSHATTSITSKDMKSIAEALGLTGGINYWGFSYGTMLGATFAAMYPDMINRMVLDGVSSAQYYTEDYWKWGLSAMTDADKVYRGFFASCLESGSKGCALATDGPSAVDDLVAKIDDLLASLDDNPLVVPSTSWGPSVLSGADLKHLIFMTLYAPKKWPALAEALAEAIDGNGTLALQQTHFVNDMLERKDPFDNPFNRRMESSYFSTVAVMCSDTNRTALSDSSIETFSKYVDKMYSLSRTGEIWAMLWVGQCRHWSIDPVDVYRGPWTIEKGLKKTKFPILFVSNTADPVTPLAAAKQMSTNFGAESASLLVTDAYGHCSLAHPSTCTARKIRSYFIDGEVPEYGTACKADPGFLFPHEGDTEAVMDEDAALRVALQDLAEDVANRPRFAGPLLHL